MDLLLGKIYSGLLHEVRLWVAIAEIGIDVWPINKLSHGLQSILVYNCSQSNSGGLMWVIILLQAINALHNKRFETIFYVHSYWNCEYCASLQSSISSIPGVQVLVYTRKFCVKSHSCELSDCLGREFLNWENFC